MKFINERNPKFDSYVGYISAEENELKKFDEVMDLVLDNFEDYDEADLFYVLYDIYTRNNSIIIIKEREE